MMAKGLERQLGRCDAAHHHARPAFCADKVVYDNVRNAYNILWDGLDANKALLAQEVWSWVYTDGKFTYEPLGNIPPPPGVGAQTGKSSPSLPYHKLDTNTNDPEESDIVQLWSLTFLAVTRNEALR